MPIEERAFTRLLRRVDLLERLASRKGHGHDPLPLGVLGYAEVTSGQGGITTTETALTGLSVSVDVSASRRIKITCSVRASSTVSDDWTRYRIKESTSTLRFFDIEVDLGGRGYPSQFSHVFTPTSGSHTYHMTLQRIGGSGTIENEAGGGFASFVLVEDIGPV